MLTVVLRFLLFGLTGAGVFWTAYDVVHGGYQVKDWSVVTLTLIRISTTLIPPLPLVVLIVASVPATLAAALYVLFLRRFTHRNPPFVLRAILAAIMGASTATLFPLIGGLLNGAYRDFASLRFLLPFTAAGAVAATLAGASLGKRAYFKATGHTHHGSGPERGG